MKKALFLLFPVFLFAVPAQIILIRHAEKPVSGHNLSLKGRQRAKAFAPFFQGSPAVLSYGLPTAVFATAPSKQEASYAMQTVLPLCKEISLSVQNQFSAQQAEQLTEELLGNPDYEGKMVLVCWPHTEIPTIAKRLGAAKIPAKWEDNVYDRLWVLTFHENGEVTYKNMPQKILYGDSPK